MKKLFYIFILLLMVSCIPVNPFVYVDYVVPSGEEYSLPRATIPIAPNGVSINFKTNDTWIWEKPEPSGFSKIAGVFWNHPHKNSARVVFDGEQLGYYFYINGISPMQNPDQMGRLWPVIIPNTYYCKTGYENGYLFVHLSDNQGHDTTIKMNCNKPTGLPGFSQPHIGGRYTIDHRWIVPIKQN